MPMTKKTFPRQTLLVQFNGSYGWLNSEHIVVATNEKDNDGKFVKRVAMFDTNGRREEVATTSGIWCAGNGVVSYQTDIEKLDGNVQRITLAVGNPGKWSYSSIDLRYPFLNAMGMQGFGQAWSLPANPVRQSPFDCRWEVSEKLSGPKNATQWIPLLSGDGAIQFDPPSGIQWVTARGDSTKLPVDMRYVSLESFRYIGWKRAYFVAQTWSRSWHKEKSLPSCVPAALIYPDQGRIEEVCAPFDANNTSNAVMFFPLRAGWLRATPNRNTAHGSKPGGLYLVRPDGKTEKLIETAIDSWSVSPDGCRVAYRHRRSDGGQYELDILDLCRES